MRSARVCVLRAWEGVGAVLEWAALRDMHKSEGSQGGASRRRQAGEEGGREALSRAETISDRAHSGRTLWQGTGSAAGGETQRGLQLYRHHAHRISAGSAIAGRDGRTDYTLCDEVSVVYRTWYTALSLGARVYLTKVICTSVSEISHGGSLPQGARATCPIHLHRGRSKTSRDAVWPIGPILERARGAICPRTWRPCSS